MTRSDRHQQAGPAARHRWDRRLAAVLLALGVTATGSLLDPAAGVAAPAPAAALDPAALVPAALATSAASDPCGPAGNEITCENSRPGTSPEVWDDTWGGGSSDIQGFATEISVDVGERVDFKIDTAASAYGITIYRTGYYDGDGARRIAAVTPSAALPQHQPECISEAATELYDCGNWAVSASWQVPETAVSGVYLAHLEIPGTGESSHITFVVRDEASDADVVFQTSDPTWVAYNDYGGSNFYWGGARGRALKLSYNRPMLTRNGPGGRDFYFANEYPLVRFLERNGYDVSYLAGVDTDRRGHLLANHDVFLSVGHDEYWSGAQRANVEAARDAGMHLQFLSGNEVYWRTRYELSADAAHTPYRTLVAYKETWDRGKIDPTPEWTGTWRDPRYAPSAQGGGRPENELIGTLYQVNHVDLAITVPARQGRMRLWRHTSLATLPAGGQATLAPHTVGYEANEDIDNGFRPPGLVRLSTTTGPTPEYLTDFGNTVVPGTTTHHTTLYRAPSGALVFSAGSVQWTWGLDEQHDSPFEPEPADPRMQQAQVNLLADMGAQPRTLEPHLTASTASTDQVGPTVTVTSPEAGANRANGARLTVAGTATDSGGGQVAGVEVSTDDGDTWHPATGTDTWTYAYTQRGVAAETIRVRATDDSAHIGPVVSRPVTVTCPCTVHGADEPAVAASDDPVARELGLRFRADVDGFLTGVRFFQGAGNTGTHVGSIWSAAGERLASATFGSSSATGWQRVDFATPVPVLAGEAYTASYTAPSGHYAIEPEAFSARSWRRGPFTVLGGYGAAPAGVFAAPGVLPTESARNTGYFVDPVFTLTDTSPLTVLERHPRPDASSVPSAAVVRARFSKPVGAASVSLGVVDANGTAVPGATSYDAGSRTATFTPAQPLAGGVRHTATVQATDSAGQQVSGARQWSFTTAVPQGPVGVCPCSLFADDLAPVLPDSGDSAPVSVGTRFRTDVAGLVTAIRFYRAAGNPGPHRATLWSAADARVLAEGTLATESSEGWQTLVLDQPVPVTPGTEYVASYRAPQGRYSVTPGAFAAADLSRGPLRVDAQAGAYTYGTGLPASRSSSSYLVDVVFERTPAAIDVEAQDPVAGAVDVPLTRPVRVWLSTPIALGARLDITVVGSPVAGTTVLGGGGRRLTFTPAAPYPAGADVRVTLRDVVSTEGAVLPTRTWEFRTRDPGVLDPQTIFGDAVPVDAAEDSSPVEVGTVFSPSRDGEVRALRFLKGAGNTGTHVGTLWDANGEVLARVTFTDETPDGWQRAVLAEPVPVQAGRSYVVSYLAPHGHYSSSLGYFSAPVTAGDLTAPAGGNGRYLYGAAGGFPTFSHGASAYFADVEYVPDATVSITARSPAASAVGAAPTVQPSVTLSAPVRAGARLRLFSGGAELAATTRLSADGTRLTAEPAGALPGDAVVRVELSGVISTAGATLADTAWSFRTASATHATTTLLGAATPAVPDSGEPDPVELGVAFTPAVSGHATGIRFFKGPGNTGTHTGTLWSATGTPLASVVFTDETAAGWQVADLATPYPLEAGTTYVVSYLAPHGHYAATAGFFADGWVSGPLSVPAGGNGRYRYGSQGGFPSLSWGATNYFVDVVFRSPLP
ncbi:DUF4082 domain-containing protein [Nocardioides sp. dk4132]|uniref:DUF4082 domain-containing protein n=1 Tax=unclassified Nocardioides TaxID=2615069 RepID=UPI001295CC72|nr:MULTISPECIES: DUF4082 domain-containing protein [unclassified Nocardioides]MQW74778.1 DUF4082 domain-containing protein [Nocardioides sp. dk4132]QGA06674.1 DUF4082 domain-containing protein [Nocardioides sp. dk884]